MGYGLWVWATVWAVSGYGMGRDGPVCMGYWLGAMGYWLSYFGYWARPCYEAMGAISCGWSNSEAVG